MWRVSWAKGGRFWFDLSLPVVEQAKREEEVEEERRISGYQGKTAQSAGGG